MAAIIDISKIDNEILLSDLVSGMKREGPVKFLRIELLGQFIFVSFGPDNDLRRWNELIYSEVSVSGVTPVSLNDFVTKIGSLINF